MNAIAEVDKHFEEIHKFVNARRNQYNEDWLVVVCTDHGGR